MKIEGGFKVGGHRGTWHEVDRRDEETYCFEQGLDIEREIGTIIMMEHDQYGEDTPFLIYDIDNDRLVQDDICNGWSDFDDEQDDLQWRHDLQNMAAR